MQDHAQRDRGFASPPDDLTDRIGGRARAWVLIDAGRGTFAAVLTIVTFAVLLAGAQLPGVDLLAAMRAADPVSTLFQALVGSLITGVTLVVTIAQLVLSQELGPLRDQRERMDGAMDFRSRVEELLDVPAAPPEPSAFLRAMTEVADEHARALHATATAELDRASEDDRPSWEELLDYADLVTRDTERVADQLDGAQFGTFAVVRASLNLNYSWRIYIGRRLLHAASSPLLRDEHRDTRDRLQTLLELLALFAPARQHVKTLYFEWDLIDLSRRILTLAGPALLVSMLALLLLDAPTPPSGTTLGIDDAEWLVTGAATVALTPFTLLASYLLRLVTVAKLTLAAGPFILRETNRRHEVDWGA